MKIEWLPGEPPNHTESWDLRVHCRKDGFCVPNDSARGPLRYWFVGFRVGVAVLQ